MPRLVFNLFTQESLNVLDSLGSEDEVKNDQFQFSTANWVVLINKINEGVSLSNMKICDPMTSLSQCYHSLQHRHHHVTYGTARLKQSYSLHLDQLRKI